MQNQEYVNSHRNNIVIMGLCSRGPYRFAEKNLKNPTVEWISWGYNEEYVHPLILEDIKSKKISKGTQTYFGVWNLNIEKKVELLRKGVIDHITYKGNYISFTVFLKDLLSKTIYFSEKDDFLCRYINM